MLKNKRREIDRQRYHLSGVFTFMATYVISGAFTRARDSILEEEIRW